MSNSNVYDRIYNDARPESDIRKELAELESLSKKELRTRLSELIQLQEKLTKGIQTRTILNYRLQKLQWALERKSSNS